MQNYHRRKVNFRGEEIRLPSISKNYMLLGGTIFLFFHEKYGYIPANTR